MLLLKANPELKQVFSRLIGTVKAPVKWKNIFAVANNNLILVGEVRSLFFSFDNKKVYTKVVEIPLEKKVIEQIPNDTLMNNMLNMTLYAFGKWGSIGGLKVEKDYATLNVLFQNVFRPIGVEPGFRTENMRFFKNGIQITYEEVLQAAMELLKSEGKVEEPEEEPEEETIPDELHEQETDDTTDVEYALGLWHKICWKIDSGIFEKSPQTESDAVKARIGHNFYITDYQCPHCGEKLYMANYPVGKELLIETEEARVFMARSYACNSCNEFFTPRPGKLLQEGDIYSLKFEEDRMAFEDYLGLLGEKAERTINSKFNEYEFERNASTADEKMAQTAKNIAEKQALESSTENAAQTNIVFTKEKGETEKSIAAERITETETPAATKNKAETETPAAIKNKAETESTVTAENINIPPVVSEEMADSITNVKNKLAVKTTEELKAILKNAAENGGAQIAAIKTQSGSGSVQESALTASDYIEAVKSVLKEKLTAKYEARMGALDKLSPRQLSELKKQLQEETVLQEEDKAHYIKKIDSRLYHAEEKLLEQKVELGKNKTFEEIGRIIEEVEKRDCPEELRQETLKKLKKIRQDRAEREVEHLILHMPLHLDRKQLSVYLDKLEQYEGVDLTPYKKRIEERKDMAEREEIATFVKRGGKKDRTALWALYNELQEQDYKKENKAPFLEKIYEKIRKMDEEEIDRICPSITSLSYREAMEAYEKISQGMFLPELKTNTLEMLERRLTKLKTDESVQLMRKLKMDMEDKMTELSGFYFYDAREEQRQAKKQSEEHADKREITGEENEEKNLRAMRRAVNGYAAGREPYEYPILVADTTRSGNGKEGFVLTPDHIFYHSLLNSGVISIMDIEKVEESWSIFGKGIYVNRFTGKKVKLPHPVNKEEAAVFAELLDEFICYLQERPESRSIAYLAKEKHEVTCCYRCGFTYKGGNICPKCGSKMNN